MGHGHQPNEKIDVYSFGVILWQMIMGKVPFEGLSQIEVGVGIQNGSLSLLSSLPNEVTTLFLPFLLAITYIKSSSKFWFLGASTCVEFIRICVEKLFFLIFKLFRIIRRSLI
eukprot:TRINITY_DN4434_c0_g1_i1.p1 TRINITY_DN4434_c0_g1~~TRINITY_DN4434_c0_g1_i1.p1  ORF type:complete len:113 (-),score=5.38 TRINITY_DN4434_c0_g1_i1:168-506(-)